MFQKVSVSVFSDETLQVKRCCSVLWQDLFYLLQAQLLLMDRQSSRASRSDFYELIRSEKKRGCTVVIASHIQEDLEVCDRLIEIENGVIDHFIDSIQQ